MSQHTALPVLLGAALLAASCNAGGPAAPTTSTQFVAASSVSISAKALAPVKVASAPDCPTVTPFIVPLVVTVMPTGTVFVVVTGITTQFTDFTGVQMPPVTLTAPVPITQFGTALDESRNPQTFSFNVGFGCGRTNGGTLAVTVSTRDSMGRNATATTTVAVN
jgi:hypothetical protein